MKQCVDIFKALSDKNRMRILLMLRVRPLCVCEISEVLNIAFSTISAHLKLLRNTGLIEDEKDGRWVIYRLVEGDEFFDDILGSVEEKLHGDKQVLNDRKVVSEITREICALKLKEKQYN
ncbi:MAG: winged helix-turn-helix transcriptional regulator [Spirochaetota bacterium]|nr:MAG: winged helix-turn-helix transcriptional regulator [Spirochaetota bacterium]